MDVAHDLVDLGPLLFPAFLSRVTTSLLLGIDTLTSAHPLLVVSSLPSVLDPADSFFRASESSKSVVEVPFPAIVQRLVALGLRFDECLRVVGWSELDDWRRPDVTSIAKWALDL